MQRLAFAAGLALVAAALAGCQKHIPETKDRLTPMAMEQMVEEPIAAVRNQGLASGQAKFEQLLVADEQRYGRDSVQVADLLTAFGVELYSLGFENDNQADSQASLNYLREAIPHYRKAFGPEHPEVAVALHSFADADINLNGGRLTPQAEGALEEALRIRRAALGPDNPETRATEARLARARKHLGSEPLNSAASALDAADDTESN
ncbi:MAG TPA: tetratricopeptide repeat protein [Allosphingosinicella sp.]|jgi:hypothetical protein